MSTLCCCCQCHLVIWHMPSCQCQPSAAVNCQPVVPELKQVCWLLAVALPCIIIFCTSPCHCTTRHALQVATIHDLLIHPDLQGYGLGSVLLQRCVNQVCRCHGFVLQVTSAYVK